MGLAVLTGCASPCEDDGLIQDDAEACPADSADAAGSSGETEGPIDIDSETDGATATASDSANSNSNSASGTDSDTDSGSESDSASASASASDTDSDSDSDSASASDSDSASETESASASDTAGSTPYCEDADNDGFGDPDACEDVPDGETPPDGSVPNGDDCDDADQDTFPGAAELDSRTECMQDEDEDGWGDDNPGDGVTAGSDCSDDGVDPCVVLITQDGTADNLYDQDLIAALQLDGYEVLNFADTDVVLADANGVDVVVISETSLSSEIAGTMADTPAPVVCLEGLIWDDMGMAAEPATTGTDNAVILDDTDPLAAGLTGNVSIVSGPGAGLFFTPAPPGATLIAGVAGNPDDVMEFAYESGAAMLDGFVAPNRRVGLGYDADQAGASAVTIEAEGIALFRAAVTWVTQG